MHSPVVRCVRKAHVLEHKYKFPRPLFGGKARATLSGGQTHGKLDCSLRFEPPWKAAPRDTKNLTFLKCSEINELSLRSRHLPTSQSSDQLPVLNVIPLNNARGKLVSRVKMAVLPLLEHAFIDQIKSAIVYFCIFCPLENFVLMSTNFIQVFAFSKTRVAKNRTYQFSPKS